VLNNSVKYSKGFVALSKYAIATTYTEHIEIVNIVHVAGTEIEGWKEFLLKIVPYHG
jgi:hypothetical protein